MDAAKEAQIIADWRAKLVTGGVFYTAWASHNTRYGYMPPITREAWGHVVETMGKLARQSDRLAQVAANIIPKLNLYGTKAQLCAAVYNGAAEVVRRGYDNVIERSGPEPDRARHIPFTERECIIIHRAIMDALPSYLIDSVQGEGWVEARVAAEVGLPPYVTPEAARMAARRG